MAKVLITGGSGLIGGKLTKKLQADGHQVVHFSRKPDPSEVPPGVEVYQWDIGAQTADWRALDGTTHIVHLAGAGIADQRWTEKYRKILRDSRIESAKLLLTGLRDHNDHQIEGFISASAIGYYGDAAQVLLTEESPPQPEAFMSKLCVDWEAASRPIEAMGIRRVVIRIGVVLAKDGGALDKMTPTARLGLGTYFGDGNQIFSWIHADDLVRLFARAVTDDAMTGVYNAAAPNPVSNYEFAKALNHALNRPFIPVPAPAFALKTIMGDMSAVVLWSANVSSQKAQQAGFDFQFERVDEALNDLF